MNFKELKEKLEFIVQKCDEFEDQISKLDENSNNKYIETLIWYYISDSLKILSDITDGNIDKDVYEQLLNK